MSKSGFASIDQPQNKHYLKEPIREVKIDTTLYEQVKNLNQGNLNLDAIGYMGNTVKYKELLSRVDRLASIYQSIGIKEGDVVPISMINTPEVPEMLLALNKIGAVTKWIDLRSTNDQIIKYVTENDAKLFIGLNILMPRMEEIIKETNLKKVISVDPKDGVKPLKVLLKSPRDFKKLLDEAKSGKENPKIILTNDSRFISYSAFSKLNKGVILDKTVSFNPDRPTLIVQSSGTTGLAKSIVHTDYSINHSINKLGHSDLPFYVGNTLLTIVPPWLAYGLINSIYLSLVFGMKAELYPKVETESVYKNIGRFDLSLAAPLHYRYLVENVDKLDKKQLERVKCLITGGDKFEKEELEKIEELLGKQIYNGYGSNEVLGAGTVNPFNENHHGTVGIPLYGNTVAAFDVNTNQELPFNEQGELCIKTETMFQEYANNPEETAEVKKTHPDGSTWIHTGDLGFVDEEGFVHVVGRLKRVIIRTAFKVFPGTIEKVISSHPAVEECVVVGVFDKQDGQVPMAHIDIKDEYIDNLPFIEEELKLKCEAELKDYEQPKYIYFVDEIPYTPNNKQDFRKLEELGNEIVKANSPKVLTLKK
ncbi:MAG: class I adenylate-forming enzyme family protein [Bacilli bacterium]|nr:class I adenylate-forming enzyme family protein [Bacilli bacterium]